MKFYSKKIPKGNLLLLGSFITISLCLMMMLSALRAEKINNQNRNGLYSGHQERFTIISAEDENAWDYVIPALGENYDNFSLYNMVYDDTYIVRGLYVKGKIETPQMIWGKYFDEYASQTDEPTIVIGSELESEISEHDGKKYYDYNGRSFQVIGIMGTERENRINEMIIMDFNSSVKISGINTDYIIDTKDADDIKEMGHAIYDTFKRPAEVIISFSENEESWSAKIFSSDMIMDTMYVMIFLSFALSTVLVTFIWLKMRQSLFFVWKLCGYKGIEKIIEVTKRYYIVSGVGFLSAVVIMVAMSRIISDIDVAIRDMIQAFLITIGLGTIILSFCYVRNLKV